MSQTTSESAPRPLLNVPRPRASTRNWRDLAIGYLKITEKLNRDFGRDTELGVYPIDFAELHLYMHRHRALEKRDYRKFDVIDYILENTGKPDYLTLLPPTVFEILRYLIQVSDSLSWLSGYKNVLNYPKIARFYRVAGQRTLKPMEYQRTVIQAYKQMGGLTQLMLIATEPGFKEMIGGPLGKFTRLISENKIVPIQQILDLVDIDSLDTEIVNPMVYESLLTSFQAIRNKPINNKVDAMAGAMTYQLTGLYYTENKLYSNFVTHSRHCLDEMQRVIPTNDPFKMPIVRDPVYFLSRILCRELSENRNEISKTLIAIRDVLKLLIEARSVSELEKQIKTLKSAKTILSAGEYFERVFVLDLEWGKLFGQSFAQVYENSCLTPHLEKALKSHSKLSELMATQPMNDIEVLRKELRNPIEYSERIAQANSALQKQVGNLYSNLINFVGEFNWADLTSSQVEVFQRIQTFDE